ncbi:MAG: hypothetical protein ACXWQZ_14015 [Ktedonobacterales bacterium]
MQQAIDIPSLALDQATTHWQQQGYGVAYQDEYLVQLFRREVPDTLLAVTALAALVALAAAIVVRLRKQPWHVVLLTLADDGRVITHHQWSRRLPPQ